jgi:hypothetical protein
VRGRGPFLVERPRDLGEAAATRVLEPDTVNDRLRQRRRSSGDATPAGGPRWFDVLVEKSLEFAGGDQPLTPRGLHGADGGNDASVDRGDADAESFGGLLAGVGEAAGLVGLV